MEKQQQAHLQMLNSSVEGGEPCTAVPTCGTTSLRGEERLERSLISPAERPEGDEKPKSRWESAYVEYLQILPKITVKRIIRHLCKALGTRVQH